LGKPRKDALSPLQLGIRREPAPGEFCRLIHPASLPAAPIAAVLEKRKRSMDFEKQKGKKLQLELELTDTG
jgi:hypothetical protein